MSLLAARRGLSACWRHHDRRTVLTAAAASVSAPRQFVIPSIAATSTGVMQFSSLDRHHHPHRRSSNRKEKTPPPPPSSSSLSSSSEEYFERTVYVHPLSQIILEYFQDVRSDWILRRGLDRSLTLHRDGSFELNLSPSLQQRQQQRQHNDPEQQQQHVNRIWTSYDDKEKKHWLTIHYYNKGATAAAADSYLPLLLHERFLLQDNLLPSWHTNRKSLPERVHMAVEELIAAVDRMDVLEEMD